MEKSDKSLEQLPQEYAVAIVSAAKVFEGVCLERGML